MKSSAAIPVAIVVAGLILAGAVYLTVRPEPSTSSGQGDPSKVAPISAADHILGNPAAKVMLVEYSDFDCPHCKNFDATLHEIVSDYGASGSVAWVYRNFPITELHPNAKKAAEAAECVAQSAGNDAYWKFADSLFANQPTDPTKYLELAQAAGASPDAVGACIQKAASSGLDATIDASRQNAIDAGAQGTPYSLILIPGKAPIVIDGAWGYADLKDQVDQALASAG